MPFDKNYYCYFKFKKYGKLIIISNSVSGPNLQFYEGLNPLSFKFLLQ